MSVFKSKIKKKAEAAATEEELVEGLRVENVEGELFQDLDRNRMPGSGEENGGDSLPDLRSTILDYLGEERKPSRKVSLFENSFKGHRDVSMTNTIVTNLRTTQSSIYSKKGTFKVPTKERPCVCYSP